MQYAEFLAGGAVGGGFAFAGKVIYAWWNESRNQGKADPKLCERHEQEIIYLKSGVSQIKDELRKGSSNFEELRKTLSRLDKNVAVLAAKTGQEVAND